MQVVVSGDSCRLGRKKTSASTFGLEIVSFTLFNPSSVAVKRRRVM